MEMIKGIIGHGYYDELVVPIIENSAREYDLTDSLAAAVSYLSVITLDYPKPWSAVSSHQAVSSLEVMLLNSISINCHCWNFFTHKDHANPKLFFLYRIWLENIFFPVQSKYTTEPMLTAAVGCVASSDGWQQMEAYPKATAVLVRNHGIYIWGDSWISAKTQVRKRGFQSLRSGKIARPWKKDCI